MKGGEEVIITHLIMIKWKPIHHHHFIISAKSIYQELKPSKSLLGKVSTRTSRDNPPNLRALINHSVKPLQEARPSSSSSCGSTMSLAMTTTNHSVNTRLGQVPSNDKTEPSMF
ncbi:unnamed protein product [Cochlearia groenlandica]